MIREMRLQVDAVVEGGGDMPEGGRGGGNGRGGNGRGGNGRGGGGAEQPEVYRRIPIPDAQKHISVRNRIDDHLSTIQNDKTFQKFVDDVRARFGVDLTFCRAGEWVEVTVEVPNATTAEAYVGGVVTKQTKSPRREPVAVADQIANVLVAEWSTLYGTLVSNLQGGAQGRLAQLQRKGTNEHPAFR